MLARRDGESACARVCRDCIHGRALANTCTLPSSPSYVGGMRNPRTACARRISEIVEHRAHRNGFHRQEHSEARSVKFWTIKPVLSTRALSLHTCLKRLQAEVFPVLALWWTAWHLWEDSIRLAEAAMITMTRVMMKAQN